MKRIFIMIAIFVTASINLLAQDTSQYTKSDTSLYNAGIMGKSGVACSLIGTVMIGGSFLSPEAQPVLLIAGTALTLISQALNIAAWNNVQRSSRFHGHYRRHRKAYQSDQSVERTPPQDDVYR